MKLITFRHNGTVKAGVLADDDRIIVKDEGPDAANAVRHLIESETGVTSWQGGTVSLDLSEVELLLRSPIRAATFFVLVKITTRMPKNLMILDLTHPPRKKCHQYRSFSPRPRHLSLAQMPLFCQPWTQLIRSIMNVSCVL